MCVSVCVVFAAWPRVLLQDHLATDPGPELHQSKEPGDQRGTSHPQGAWLLCARQTPPQGLSHFVVRFI